ncbi:MAG TPA: 3-keto-5-aminohexanoate cleavage protein, partial [Micromonosporaceae bacterium]
SPTDGFSYSSVEYPIFPNTLEEIAKASAESYQAGASVAHLHGPWSYPQGGSPTIEVEQWREMGRLVRQSAPGMIVQFGVAGGPLEQRRQLMTSPGDAHPDMMSVCLTEHDYNFNGKEMYIMHTRPELIDYARLCTEANVKPEFEVFHIGAYYNLLYTLEHGDVLPPAPHWLTMFIGSTGGVWTPGTPDEIEYRIRHLPPNCIWQVCPRGGMKGTMTVKEYDALIIEALLRGGHVRIGPEDNPFIRDGEKARSTAELVDKVVKMVEMVGRTVATPAEAREIIGLPADATVAA